MDSQTVPARSAAIELGNLLDSPEIASLIAELQATRSTGRPGYPIRSMLGIALAKLMYAIPTWTRTTRLVAEHAALQTALGCEGGCPSEWACYRFAVKLRKFKPLLDSCIVAVLARLHEANPGMGESIAIDGSDLPAYANGQRFVSKNGRERKLSEYSDPDASWGHRSAVSTRKGGGYYGYKVHASVDTLTGLPLAWTVETAKDAETTFALGLLDATRERGFVVRNAIMDKGYDNAPIHDGCMERGVCPITPLRQTPAVKRGDHKPRTCERGEWTFGGTDYKRQATKWRCPTGECTPKSTWIEADRQPPADPAPHGPVQRALQEPWCRRARVRQAQARVGAPAAPRPRNRARPAPCRLDDPGQARHGSRALTSTPFPQRPKFRAVYWGLRGRYPSGRPCRALGGAK